MAVVKKWYNTNFSKSITLNGKDTFHFWVENSTAATGDTQDLYLLVVPDIPGQDLTILNTTETTTTYFNGADIREVSRVMKDYTVGGITDWSQESPAINLVENLTVTRTGIGTPAGDWTMMNVTGEHRYYDGGNFITNIINNQNDFYRMLLPPDDGIFTYPGFQTNVWHTIRSDAKTNFRLDYNGGEDDNIKLTFIITNRLPNEINGNSNSFWPGVKFYDNNDGGTPPVNALDWVNIPDGDIVIYGDDILNQMLIYVSDSVNDATPYYELMEYGEWFGQDLRDRETKIGALSGIKLLHMYGFFNDIAKTVIDVQESHVQCYKNFESETSRDVSYWINKDLHSNPIISELSSYALTRTNPKISGNIKLITDSKGNIYMESIDATEDLSNEKFKKIEIAANGDFANDLKRIFGTVEPSSLYHVFEEDNTYLNTKRTYTEQYDFFYGAGASLEASKLYSEEFAIFAPLWIRKKLPEYFVIFKNENPINDSTYNNGNNIDIINETFANAQIVKTFDLRPGTKLGTYLNNIVTDERFRESPISVNYENNELTTWFGASYTDGVVAQKGLYMYDFYKQDRPIIEFENEITSGFEDNKIISMNLMNLDFKFDDLKSDEYSINRYFGLYMNAIELAQFNIYAKGLELLDNQSPEPRIGIDGLPYSSTSYININDNGILLPIDYINDSGINTLPEKNNLLSGRLPILSDLQNDMRFFYVSDRDNHFDRAIDLVRTDKDDEKFDSIRISTNEKDLQKYGGISSLVLKNEAELGLKQSAFIKIDFSNVANFRAVIKTGEVFEIIPADHQEGHDVWEITANPTGLNPGQAWDYPVYDISTNKWLNTFSPDGTPEQVAQAFATCMNNFTESLFTSFNDGTSVYIGFYSTGSVNNGINLIRYMQDASPIENVKFFELNKNIDDIFIATTSANPATFTLIKDYTVLSNYKAVLDNINTLNITFSRKDSNGSDIPLLKAELELNSDGLYEAGDKRFNLILAESIENYSTGDEWNQTIVLDNNSNPITYISQNFIGGNDINKNSAVIVKENIINITKDTYFQAAKGDYSTVKNWNVQGIDLLYLDNVNFETLTVEDTIIIYLTDLTKQFYTAADNNITGFNTFAAKFGIFSILPFKEFDTDLILSSYSYGPYDELLKYYGNIKLDSGEDVELGLNNSYILELGNGILYGIENNIEVELPNNILWPFNNEIIDVEYNPNTTEGLLFNTFSPNREYDMYYYDSNKSPVDGGNVYYSHIMSAVNITKFDSYKFIAGVDNTLISNFPYKNDKDLKDFEGFFILQDIIHESDIDALTTLKEDNDIARFTYTAISSEYERLRELSNKDLAVTSKVVPFINKWVMRNKDVRDNPYRLDNSLAFGMTNFSPLLDNSQIDPKLHSHEFFYIDSFPKDFDPDNLPNHRLYFFDKLDKIVYDGKSWLELMRTDINNWFAKYFTVGYPTELYKDTAIEMNRQQRFGLIETIADIDIAQTIFHGAKIQFENPNGLNSDYGGYSISAVMQLIKPEQFTNESPVGFEIITNKKNKTILIIGTIKITDYKIPNGIDYTFMYASKSALRASNMVDFSKHAGVWDEQVLVEPYITHAAEYGFYTNRLDFRPDLISTGYIHANGYSNEIMNDIQIGGGVTEFADVKLNFGVEITTGKNNISISTREYDLISNSLYVGVAKEEIKPINGSLYNLEAAYGIADTSSTINALIKTFNNGGYSDITQLYSGQNYNNPLEQIYTIKKMRNYYNIVTDSNKLIVYYRGGILPETSRSVGVIDSISGFPTGVKYNLDSPYYIDDNTNTWYIQGGELFNEAILSKFSFGSMVNLIHSKSPLVTYTTLGGDGIPPTLKFIENDIIYKTNKLAPILDVDKPDIYKNKEVIGFVIEDINTTDVLYRHRGEFEPKTRELMFSWIRENESMTTAYDIDFLGMNTQLLPHANFGISRNMYYNKVADTEILKISSNSGYESLYAYIDEISIAHDNFSIFKTTWDAAYFKKYETISKYSDINGIEVLKEFKSFFGSKAMNVPNDIYIEIFENSDFLDIEIDLPINPITLDTEKSDILSIANVTSNDTTGTLLIDIDVTQRIIDIMVKNGAVNEFKKLANNGIIKISKDEELKLVELTEEYLRLNIVNLYFIEDIKMYVKNFADKATTEIFVYNMSDFNKQFNGYVYDKNANIESITNLRSKITKNLKTEDYQSFTISINVQRT